MLLDRYRLRRPGDNCRTPSTHYIFTNSPARQYSDIFPASIHYAVTNAAQFLRADKARIRPATKHTQTPSLLPSTSPSFAPVYIEKRSFNGAKLDYPPPDTRPSKHTHTPTHPLFAGAKRSLCTHDVSNPFIGGLTNQFTENTTIFAPDPAPHTAILVYYSFSHHPPARHLCSFSFLPLPPRASSRTHFSSI